MSPLSLGMDPSLRSLSSQYLAGGVVRSLIAPGHTTHSAVPTVAGLAWFAYDFLLTLYGEVTRIWQGSKRTPSVVYFLWVRYSTAGGLTYLVYSTYFIFDITLSKSTDHEPTNRSANCDKRSSERQSAS